MRTLKKWRKPFIDLGEKWQHHPQAEGEALALSTLSSTGIQKRQKAL
jgi:hypothetical protein